MVPSSFRYGVFVISLYGAFVISLCRLYFVMAPSLGNNHLIFRGGGRKTGLFFLKKPPRALFITPCAGGVVPLTKQKIQRGPGNQTRGGGGGKVRHPSTSRFFIYQIFFSEFFFFPEILPFYNAKSHFPSIMYFWSE